MNTLSTLGPTHLLNEPFSLRSTVTVCTDQSCISKVQTIYGKYFEAFTFNQCFILLFLVLPCFKFHPTQPSLIFFSWGKEGYQSSGIVPNRRTQGHDRQILSRFSEFIYQGQKLTGAHGPQILVWAAKLLPVIQLNIQTFVIIVIL